jgi:hypothetical protein
MISEVRGHFPEEDFSFNFGPSKIKPMLNRTMSEIPIHIRTALNHAHFSRRHPVTGLICRLAPVIFLLIGANNTHAAKLLARGSSTEMGMIVDKNEPEEEKPLTILTIPQRYAQAIQQIVKGDQFFEQEKYSDSIPNYREAIRILEGISSEDPGWNPTLISFRKKHCQQVLTSLRESKAGMVRTVKLSEAAGESKLKAKIVASGPNSLEEDDQQTRTLPTVNGGRRSAMMQPGDNETAPSAETQAITAQLSSQLQDALTQLESYRSRQALLDRQLAELTQRNQSLEEALEKAAQEEAPDAELLAEQENQIEMLRKQLSDLRTSRQRDEGASARANSRLRAALARAISVLREDQPELAEQLEQMVRGQEEQPQQDTAPESGS